MLLSFFCYAFFLDSFSRFCFCTLVLRFLAVLLPMIVILLAGMVMIVRRRRLRDKLLFCSGVHDRSYFYLLW